MIHSLTVYYRITGTVAVVYIHVNSYRYMYSPVPGTCPVGEHLESANILRILTLTPFIIVRVDGTIKEDSYGTIAYLTVNLAACGRT